MSIFILARSVHGDGASGGGQGEGQGGGRGEKFVRRQYRELLPRSQSNLRLLLNELDFTKDDDRLRLFAEIFVGTTGLV